MPFHSIERLTQQYGRSVLTGRNYDGFLCKIKKIRDWSEYHLTHPEVLNEETRHHPPKSALRGSRARRIDDA